jgi:hypothetical protein
VNVKITGALVARANTPDGALLAVTVQVVVSVATRSLPVSLHAAPTTTRVTTPVPDPPPVVTVTDVPASALRMALVIFRAACGTPAKVKSTGAVNAGPYDPDAALVPITVHVEGCVAVSTAPVTVQPVPVTE